MNCQAGIEPGPRVHFEEVKMRTDFEEIKEGSYVILFPTEGNPIHNRPVRALYQSGYFYCDGSDHANGPDYYFRDVAIFNQGFEMSE